MMQTTYTLPPHFFYPRVAFIRSATTGEFVTIANAPARDEAEPLELHLTHRITTPGSTASGIVTALPMDHTFLEDGAASGLVWDVSAPSPTLASPAANSARQAERAADQITRNALRVYGGRR